MATHATMKKFIMFNRLTGIFLASLVSANAFAFHCSTDCCKGFVTDFVAYADSEVSIKLDGVMTIGGVTCEYLTLSQQGATCRKLLSTSAIESELERD